RPTHQYHYVKWLRYYLDFCNKYHFNSTDKINLPHFIKKLGEKKQSVLQQKQASHAVSLYYELLRSGAQALMPVRKRVYSLASPQWKTAMINLYAEIKTRHYSPSTLKTYSIWGCFGYIVEADIKGFFDNVDHDWMLEMSSERIDDKALLELIAQWLKTKVHMPDGSTVKPLTGTPQGGVISPVLANIYLHYVIDLWFECKIKPKLIGKAFMVRYADDYVMAFQYQRDARALYKSLPARLRMFGLEVAKDKTSMMRFSRFEVSMRRRIKFLVFEYYWWHDLEGKPRVMRRTARLKLKELRQTLKEWIKRNRHKRLYQLAKELRIKMLGHYRYFGIRGNGKSLWRYHAMVLELLFKWLNRHSQRRSYNWSGFKQLLEMMQLPKPTMDNDSRVTITWLFSKGATLHGSNVITEEPGAGIPHAGICVGASG
ncbi:MAG: hypothetical protein GY774_24290, partial [Planctomycetes bacterium]|nr:hypothetical protein [Planctomycetota bacterium]